MEIDVVQNVLKLNDEVAALNRQVLRDSNVRCLNLMGSPGAGKTLLLEKTLAGLDGLEVGVITGDLTTTRDAERLSKHCRKVTQINTGKGCHLDANQVRQGLSSMPLAELDLLIIENVGNLICPVGFDLGQDAKVGLFSVPEGDDKPAKHPYIVVEAALLILNKMDLLPYVPFDMDVFDADIRRLREDVEVMKLSAANGEGLEPWLDWLRAFARAPAQTAAV
jgi:hydrogenase nickel incorporation protein HypB